MQPSSHERLRSLDALRGFDMLWIVGGGEVLRAVAKSSDSSVLAWMSAQTEHPEWNGFTFWDLIFPLFLFLAGVSLPFSFGKRIERGDTRVRIGLHVLRRGLVLVLLGLVYNGLLKFEWSSLRCASVLGRIGLAWMFAAWISLRTSWRGQLAWAIALLLGYWAAMSWIPVAGFGAGNLEPGATLADWFDRAFLPGRLYRTVRDPEGLLSTVPAIATALFGVLAGTWLRECTSSGARKTVVLAAGGLVCLALGALWNLAFPINKNLWSSSFVMWTSGWSLLLLAIFYHIIDVRGFVRWSFPLAVIGTNAITIYLLERFGDFEGLSKLLLAEPEKHFHPVLIAALPLGLEWLVLYWMYRRKLFLRV